MLEMKDSAASPSRMKPTVTSLTAVEQGDGRAVQMAGGAPGPVPDQPVLHPLQGRAPVRPDCSSRRTRSAPGATVPTMGWGVGRPVPRDNRGLTEIGA
jgi:hypothetical protein